MMPNSYGDLCLCFTPLAAYIMDTPEAAMLAGVGGKTSHITKVLCKELGDAHLHEFHHGL
jgi:hypothetical protein